MWQDTFDTVRKKKIFTIIHHDIDTKIQPIIELCKSLVITVITIFLLQTKIVIIKRKKEKKKQKDIIVRFRNARN